MLKYGIPKNIFLALGGKFNFKHEHPYTLLSTGKPMTFRTRGLDLLFTYPGPFIECEDLS